MRLLVLGLLFVTGNSALALDSAGNGPTRADAVALYVFGSANFDSANLVYKDLAPNPLDLKIIKPTALYSVQPNYLELTEPNLLRSIGSADKIVNACKTSNELTIEMWVDSRTPSEKLVNHEDEKKMAPGDYKQSLRIMSLGDTYFKEYHNFGFYQAYNMGDAYKATTRTTGNSAKLLSGDFVDPMTSAKESFLLQTKQHIVYVKSAGGTTRLYVSDENGVDSLAVTETTGFGGDQSNWHKSGTSVTYDSPDDSTGAVTRNLDIRLAIGNEASGDNDFGKPTIGGEGPQKHSRHWPWMGKIYMAAVYCKALKPTDVLGAAAPHTAELPIFAIDVTRDITKSMTKAQNIYTRMTGVKTPIDNPLIGQMADLIDSNQSFAAAGLAAQDSNFLNITVRDMAAKMSTREETISIPMNDFTATIVGATRDGMDIRKLLTDNILYMADPTKAAVPSNLIRDRLSSNRHYQSLSDGDFDLKKVLVTTTQKMFSGTAAVDHPDPAGLLTSRAWMSAHAIAGTNRRPVEYTFREFMCTPIDKWADSSGSDSFVGRDIDRFPGGSHTKFTQSCRACHSRMDPLRGAFAYFTFSNSFVKHSLVAEHLAADVSEDNKNGMSVGLKPTDPAMTTLADKGSVNYVVDKMNHNETVFPGGRVTVDNSFQNSALDSWGQSYFGWRGPTSGKGVGQLGGMIARSEQFSRCMAKRVFASVCKRESQDFDSQLIKDAATEFESNGYKLDYLFKRIVVTPNCLGEDK